MHFFNCRLNIIPLFEFPKHPIANVDFFTVFYGFLLNGVVWFAVVRIAAHRDIVRSTVIFPDRPMGPNTIGD